MTNRRIIQKARNPSETGYAALKKDVALVDLSHKTILRLTGADPTGMLGAILSNDVPQEENLGTYALLLNPKGRVQTDLRVIRSSEGALVITEPEGADAAREILGRYAPFSRVKLEDAPLSILGLYGPRAKKLLDLDLAEHESSETEIAGAPLLAAGVAVPVPGYDLIGPPDALDTARQHLLGIGAVPADHDAHETARIKAGIPRFGPDITPDAFPAEAGLLERAVSFAKGCYPGQETVARMHYRGHPNRELRRLTVEGTPPPPRTPILQGEKQVGAITSVAPLPVNGKILALGYLHRNANPDVELRAGEARLVPHPPEGAIGNDSQ